MADLKAQIAISADASGVDVGIQKAKRSLNSLGVAAADASTKASRSIDKYVQRLETQAATTGKTSRETDLYKLALRGASEQQLQAANSAIKLKEAYERGEAIGDKLRKGFIAFGAIAGTALVAATVAFDQLVKKAGAFQSMAEKTGDTAQNLASLAVAAGTAGLGMDAVVSASTKLTKNLVGVDDESKDAGAAVKALGLNLSDFKALKPADQMEAVAKALAGFQDGAQKSAVAMALFGKAGADVLPFLVKLGDEGGRQVILTEAQIQASDEYANKQAKARTELLLHAEAIASNMLPALNEFTEALANIAKDQELASTASSILKGALSGLIVAFQAIVVAASDVGFALLGVGREIGAVAAQAVALAHLDIKGFRAISDAVKDDGVRARAELDKFQARIMSIGQPKYADPRILGNAGSIAEQTKGWGKKSLVFNGVVPKSAGSAKAADDASKAQLAADLDRIKSASSMEVAIYANAEIVMQAKRAAGLLDERKYYAEKLAFLQLNTSAQEAALVQQIARLQQEQRVRNLSGKDQINNDKAISAAQAQLAILRAGYTSKLQVLSIEEEAASKKIALAYLTAQQAAQDYFGSIQKQQDRELSGVGQGSQARDRNAGISQIEDRYNQQRRDLENQKSQAIFNKTFDSESQQEYEKQLALIVGFQAKSISSYNHYYDNLIAKQGDWALGANEALQNYLTDAHNVFSQTESLVSDAFKGMEDALTTFVTTGKLDFKSLADSIISDLVRMQVKSMIAGSASGGILGSLFSMFGVGIGSGGSGTITGGSGLIPSHESGLGYVPYDGYLASLHKGERVMTAAENSSGGSPNFNFTYNIPAGVTQAELMRAMQMTRAQTKADVIESTRRAGVFAR